MKFDEGRSTVVSAFQAFDFSWLVKSGASSRGPSRAMRTLGEYKETLVVGRQRTFCQRCTGHCGSRDVSPCPLSPFPHTAFESAKLGDRREQWTLMDMT